MSNERILEKIRKCLAMASDSRGNAAEAANALRQAQALMAKHGLEDMDIAASEMSDLYMRSKVSVKNPMQWEWSLMNTICRAFGCLPLFYEGGPDPTNKGHFRFIGRKSDIAVAEYTATVLMRQIVKARTDYVANMSNYDDCGNQLSRGDKSKKANAFCLAWVITISKTVVAFADPEGKIQKGIEAYCEKKVGNIVDSKKTKTVMDYDALNAGREAAEGVSLFRAAGKNADTLRIG